MDAGQFLTHWTETVLAYHMEEPTLAVAASSEDAGQAVVARAHRLMRAAGRTHAVVLGADVGLAAPLFRCEFPVLVVEPHQAQARSFRAAAPHLPLLADTSPLCLLMLLHSAGLSSHTAHVVQTPRTRLDPRLQQLARLHRGARMVAVPDAQEQPSPPSLSVAAILHPEEPDLASFFAQIPPWVEELVLVWDAARPPSPPDAPVPLRQEAHLLEDGFHAQRNRALALCRGEWVLFLDADERLAPEVWTALPSLMQTPAVHGWWLPRETCYPDLAHCLAGFGLWPDVQLRLFRRTPGLRFEGAVHEQLQGLAGEQAVACRLHIRHEQRLQKSTAALTAKLARFDAVGGAAKHRLQAAYPSIKRSLLRDAMASCPEALLLPLAG